MSTFDERARARAEQLKKRGHACILAIESSCDETAAAVVKDGREVLSNVIATQIPVHKRYGGVVPEIASRSHTQTLVPVVQEALEQAGVTFDGIDAIAVTQGPGLIGAVLTGFNFAKGLALALDKPLVGVHHIQGHICANFLAFPELNAPFIALAVSGGHSHILEARTACDFTLLGATRDDAAGEAFDKAARVLGLGYPGGVEIDRVSEQGDPRAFRFATQVEKEDNCDFSFSGIKTALVNLVHTLEQKGEPVPVADLAASFQEAVVRQLAEKTMRAVTAAGSRTLVLAGGVAANRALRERLARMCRSAQVSFYCPPPDLCTDNAAMIGAAGFFTLMNGSPASADANAFATGGLPDFFGGAD
ncbi:MAG: tRNA (adenosine(37)-N6)-threonylcarbamoyltransferase complex transferase subunit TsaD [Clostridia bacterium]|nr:tRNA (adenosine(37)-N6)-threonylcarbamoyltransferase complex transferase subunit TsaD [Clostridia bacterium]